MPSTYESKNAATFHNLTQQWMLYMKLEDDLLATNEFFLLGQWLSYLPTWASSSADLSGIEYDARSILTTWGDRTASEDLHEYRSRDWSALIASYYAPRWHLYFDSLEMALKTGTDSKPVEWYKFGMTGTVSRRPFQMHHPAIPMPRASL
jgi:alpha-N-acetylglucosaminidase